MFFGSKQFFWLKVIFSKGAYEDIEINKKSQNFIPGLYDESGPTFGRNYKKIRLTPFPV